MDLNSLGIGLLTFEVLVSVIVEFDMFGLFLKLLQLLVWILMFLFLFLFLLVFLLLLLLGLVLLDVLLVGLDVLLFGLVSALFVVDVVGCAVCLVMGFCWLLLMGMLDCMIWVPVCWVLMNCCGGIVEL